MSRYDWQSDLTPEEMRALSMYNAERFRGLVHTDEYRFEMAKLQERYAESARSLGADEYRL